MAITSSLALQQYMAALDRNNQARGVPSINPYWKPGPIGSSQYGATQDNNALGLDGLLKSGLAKKGIGKLIGALSPDTVTTAAGNEAWNAAATEATNALSSSGADVAQLGAEAAPETSISNFAGAATPYLGAAGAAYGAYNAFEGVRKKDPLQAGLGGAGVGLGLNAMGYALGPYGWAAMLAAPAAGALINKWTDKDRWKEEQDRAQKLADAGVSGWEELVKTQPKLTEGRSLEELIAIEDAKKARGQYSNVDFARSRDEKDLRPEDIWGYSTFGEKYGNDWLGKFNEDQRRGVAQKYLDAGAIDEGRGQIKINSNPELEKMIEDYLAGGAT